MALGRWQPEEVEGRRPRAGCWRHQDWWALTRSLVDASNTEWAANELGFLEGRNEGENQPPMERAARKQCAQGGQVRVGTRGLHECPRAARTKYHMGGFNNRYMLSSSWRPEVWDQGGSRMVLSKGCEGRTCSRSLFLLAHGMFMLTWCSLWTCACLNISFYKDTSHIGSGIILMTPFQFDYLCKDPVFKSVHILRYWG